MDNFKIFYINLYFLSFHNKNYFLLLFYTTSCISNKVINDVFCAANIVIL